FIFDVSLDRDHLLAKNKKVYEHAAKKPTNSLPHSFHFKTRILIQAAKLFINFNSQKRILFSIIIRASAANHQIVLATYPWEDFADAYQNHVFLFHTYAALPVVWRQPIFHKYAHYDWQGQGHHSLQLQ